MRLIAFTIVLGVLGVASDAFANAYVNNAYVNNAYVNNAYVNNAYVNNAYVNSAYIDSGPFAGATMPGMSKGGTVVQYPWLDGSQLTGWTNEAGSWTFRNGEWFEGVMLAATTKSPTSDEERALWLWIADAVGSASNDGPTWAYLLYAYIPQDDGAYTWMPLCGYDASQNPIYAVPLAGEWNYTSGTAYGGRRMRSTLDTVTFACLGAALGKCAASGFANTIGYRPWGPDTWRCIDEDGDGMCTNTRIPAVDSHQACTRLVTADYCGDGKSHTKSGTFIDVYENGMTPTRNVSSSSPPPGYATMEFEALWGPDGATRLSCVRLDVLGFTPMSECPTYVDAAGNAFRHEIIRQCSGGGWDFYDFESVDALLGNSNTNLHSTELSSIAPRSIHLPPL